MSGALGATAAQQDLIIEQYSTFNMVVTWTNQNGNPVDYTGASAILQMRTSVSASNVLYQASSAQGSIRFGNAGGIVIGIPAAITGSFQFTNAVYDLLVQLPNQGTRRILSGNIIVVQGVSILVPPQLPN